MSSSSSSSAQRIVCGDEAYAICSVPNGLNESLFAVACGSSSSSNVKIFYVDAQTHRLKEKTELMRSVPSSSGKIADVDCCGKGPGHDLESDDGANISIMAACTREGDVSVFQKEGKNVSKKGKGQYSSCKFDPNDGRVLAMVTIGGDSICFYDHENDKEVGSFITGGSGKKNSKGDWSKANRNEFAFTKDGNVFVVDSRVNSSNSKPMVSQTSSFRDVAFSANEEGRYIITASEDWLVKTWDMRKNDGTPVKCFAGHKGSVTKARFNPVYESICLSSSLDGTAKLWRDSDLGRLPDDDDSGRRSKKANVDENSNNNNNSEGISLELTTYGNLHTTPIGSFSPVVDACWSSNDPWVFSAITMDGTVALDVVPRSEKYRILL